MAMQTKSPSFGGSQGQCIYRVRPLKRSTQQSAVLELLRQQPMSAAEIQWEVRIADARAVVRDLRKKGYQIDPVKHPRAEGPPIQRYHLIETD